MANDEYVLVVNQQNTSSHNDHWKQGDRIMTDKGFKIEKKAGNVWPEIKCPSFCISRMPNKPGQCSPVQPYPCLAFVLSDVPEFRWLPQ